MRPIIAPIKIDGTAVQESFDDVHVVAEMAEGGMELNAKSRFYGGSVTGTQAKAKPTGSQLRQDLDLLHHDQGMAGERRGDGGSQANPAGTHGGGGEERQGVEPGTTGGEPCRRDAHLFGLFDASENPGAVWG